MHEQKIVLCNMKLNVYFLSFNRIIISILKQLIYESRFFRTKLLTKCIQKVCRRTKILRFVVMPIIKQSIDKPFWINYLRLMRI